MLIRPLLTAAALLLAVPATALSATAPTVSGPTPESLLTKPSFSWTNGPWTSQLSQRYQSKIVDQNSAAATGPGTSGPREVARYAQYNLMVKYTGIKDLSLSFTINNLTNANPPVTNHTGYRGYLTSSADVLGRAYALSAEYKF